MRIAHIIGYFQPELGYEEYYTAKRQVELGHDVSVITSDRIFPFENVESLLKEAGSSESGRMRKAGKSVIEGIRVYRLPTAMELSLLYDFILVKNIRRILQEVRPDIVHAHEPIQGTSAMAAFHKDLGYKLVVDKHGYATSYQEADTPKDRLVRLEYHLIRVPISASSFTKADAIIAVTEQTKSFLVKTHKVDPQRIDVIPLGVEEKLFHPRPKQAARVREEAKVAKDELLVLTAGRHESGKKLEDLIIAFSKVVGTSSTPYLKLMVIGTGDQAYLDRLKHLAKKEGISDRTIWKGFIPKERLADYYCAADIGWWGKASITIIEAMACGLPVVIPDLDTMNHLVSYGNGLTYPLGDREALAERLQKLVNSKSTRKKMGKNAMRAVEENYSYKVRTDKVMEIYNRCLRS